MTRLTHWLAGISLFKALGVLAVFVVLLVSVLMVQQVREAEAEYQEAIVQIERIQSVASSGEIYSLSREDMSWLEQEFSTLQQRIDHIEELSNLPLGLTGAVSGAPWVSDRYDAVMETLEVGRMMAESGQAIANIGDEAMRALDDTGIRYEEGQDGATWLDVLHRREDDINQALDKMDEAIERREAIDDDKLPNRIQDRLRQIDELIAEFSGQRELANDLPLAFTALGAEEQVRYLALFQNPAEMRPTGGFVGTIAFIEIERGQIRQYDFHDVYEVSKDYQESVDVGVPPPWAISEYIRSDYLQYQDANWWADFPESAELIKEMTVDAGWGEVDAVVGVQPDVISDLLSVTGPIIVDVDGEEREITPDNLLEESERQRRIEREGEEPEVGHKEVISLIGGVLLDDLSRSDRDDMIDAAFLMFNALDRRDIQAYSSDDAVTAFLEDRNWAGRIKPDPETPVIAPILANITGLKTSLVMQPSMELELLDSEVPGVSEAILTVSLKHFGAEEGDPFYEGFQRWWLDVILPDGAAIVDTEPGPVSDPDASNGGAYVINLPVAERKSVAIRFSFPSTDKLLIRRQPGLQLMNTSVSTAGCDESLEFDLDSDAIIDLAGDCPEIDEQDED